MEELSLIGKMIIVLLVLFVLSFIVFVGYGYVKDGSSVIETRNIACDKIGKFLNDKYVEKNANYCYKSAFADNFGTCPKSDSGTSKAKKIGVKLSQTQGKDGVWCCAYAKRGSSCDSEVDTQTIDSSSEKSPKAISISKISELTIEKLVLSGPYDKTKSLKFKGLETYFLIKNERLYLLTPTNQNPVSVGMIKNTRQLIIDGTGWTLIENQDESYLTIANKITGKFIVKGNTRFYDSLSEADNNVPSLKKGVVDKYNVFPIVDKSVFNLNELTFSDGYNPSKEIEINSVLNHLRMNNNQIFKGLTLVANIVNNKVKITFSEFTGSNPSSMEINKMLRSIDGKFVVEGNTRFYDSLSEAEEAFN